MNRPRIAKLTEEIALMRNSYEFMEELELSWKKFIEGVSHFDNMVNSDIPLPFIPLSKWIPMDQSILEYDSCIYVLWFISGGINCR
jgi:hypothetical protein